MNIIIIHHVADVGIHFIKKNIYLYYCSGKPDLISNPLSNLESIISGTIDSIKNFVHRGSILFFQNSSSLNILSTTKPIKKYLLIMFRYLK